MATELQLVTVFQQFCEAENWQFYPTGSSSFVTYVSGQTSKWETMCTIKNSRISILSELPFVVPAEKRLTVLEFLMWANSQLLIGNFAFNLQRCDIHFKTSIEVADGILTTRMLATLLYLNLNAVNFYVKGLQPIIFAGKTTSETIRFLSELDKTEKEEEEEEEEDTQALREILDDPDLAKLLGDDDAKEKGAGD